jgi:hypothetical protein
MTKTDTSENKPIITDPSLEFDIFEMARQRLVEVFTNGGYEPLEAEKIALYVIQGLRPVPKLLNVLTRIKDPKQDEILDALGLVLDEIIALYKAKRMLLHLDEDGGEQIVTKDQKPVSQSS